MFHRIFIAALLATGSASVWAADNCAVDIEGTDQMTFSVKTIDVDASCKAFTVNLSHPGSLPKQVMGHNWVLTTQADMKGVANEGIAAGMDNNFLKPGDERVIAATRIIGAGETTAVTFDTAKLKKGGDYRFFCSFPGHAPMMNGTLTFGD